MNEDQVLAAMVKGRESCRRVIQSYEMIRARNSSSTTPVPGDSKLLPSANRAASQMIEYLSELSGEVNKLANSETNRQYVLRLTLEIKEMLEKAMILERETRSFVCTSS